MSAPSMTMYVYVGTANSRPDSRTPRRFAAASRTASVTATPTRWSRSGAIADTMAAVPAAIDTATVSV